MRSQRYMENELKRLVKSTKETIARENAYIERSIARRVRAELNLVKRQLALEYHKRNPRVSFNELRRMFGVSMR